VRERPPESIQVVRTDSSRVELRSARLVGDSLVGLAAGAGVRTSDARPVAIALSQISRVAIRQPDTLQDPGCDRASLVVIGGLLFGLAFGQGLSMWYDELAETED